MLQKPIRFAACAVVVLHLGVLWQTGGRGGGSVSSNLIQLSAALLATLSCVLAAVRTHGFKRRFWSLTSLSLFLWSIAQAGWMYQEDVLGLHVPTISWVTVLF